MLVTREPMYSSMSDFVYVLVTRPQMVIGANYWFRSQPEAVMFARKINLLYPHLPRLFSSAVSSGSNITNPNFNGYIMIIIGISGDNSGDNSVAVQYEKGWVSRNQDKVLTIHPLSLVEVKLQ